MISDCHSVLIHFYTIVNQISVLRFACRKIRNGDACTFSRRSDSVCLNDMKSQAVRVQRSWFSPLDCYKHIAGHQPGHQTKLLDSVEVVHSGCVAGVLFSRPYFEFRFRLFLPTLRFLLRHAQHFPVNRTF